MHDSGQRQTTETGAQSDPSHANAAMELLSPYSLWNLSMWLGKGAEKYAPRNWEKGIPFSVCIGKLQRHLQQYIAGQTNEDHLAAVGFWWHALSHYESMIVHGQLPASLNDLPQYEKLTKFVCPAGWVIERDGDGRHYPSAGWFVCKEKDRCTFLRKDLQLHRGTGWAQYCQYGEAPGYWPTKEAAEDALEQYLEKQQDVAG